MSPSPRKMGKALGLFMRPIERPRLGDVAWIAWRRNLPQHLAILSEHEGRDTLIHALRGAGGVKEHGLVDETRNLIVSWWRYPGLSGDV